MKDYVKIWRRRAASRILKSFTAFTRVQIERASYDRNITTEKQCRILQCMSERQATH